MSVSATTALPRIVSDPTNWASTVPDGHAPDPPVVNGNDQLSFDELLSAINPLQHIPVIGSIYRAITGDTISPAAQIVGGALLGGPIGLVLAAGNAVIGEATGSDIGEKIIALVGPDRDQPTSVEKLAAAPAVPAAEPQVSPQASPQPAAAVVVAPPARVELSAELQALAASLAKGNAAGATATAGAPVLAAAKPAAPLDGGPARRDLAYYWRQAESRPAVTSGPMPTAPSRVLPFSRPLSLPEKTPAVPVAASAAAVALAEAPAADRPSPPATAPAAPSKTEGPPSAWFAAAMARGLDRYEASKGKAERGASLDRAE